MQKIWSLIRPIVLWDYRRGSWQYDVICGLIVAFIFLTPREFFGDQPRPPILREVEAVSPDVESEVFLINAQEVSGANADDIKAKMERLLHQRTGRELQITEIRPNEGPNGGLDSYLVYARP